MSPLRADAHPEASAWLGALEAHLRGRGFETKLHDAGLTVIAPPVEGGLRFTTMVVCRVRWKDGGRLWFFTDEDVPLAEASRIVDAAVAITALLRPTPTPKP